MLAGSWAFDFYYYQILKSQWADGSAVKYFLLQLNLATENVVATWYSSMLLLAVAVMSFVCFRLQRQELVKGRENNLSYGWLLFCFLFALLSLDEIGSLHENIGQLNALNPHGDFPLGWVVILSIPIGCVAVLMLAFCWMQVKRAPWAVVFAVTGILLFVSIPVHEYFEVRAMELSPNPLTWQRPVRFLLLEEGSEIFGATCMLISTVVFAAYMARPGQKLSLKTPMEVAFSLSQRNVLLILALLCCFSALTFILLEETILMAGQGDKGDPKSWFPSVTAFLAFLLSLHLFIKNKALHHPNRTVYLFLAILSIVLSAYYGSSMYSYFIWLKGYTVGMSLNISLAVTAAVLGIRLLVNTPDMPGRIAIAVWVLLLSTALGINTAYSAPVAFVAFASLAFYLFRQLPTQKAVLKTEAEVKQPLQQV